MVAALQRASDPEMPKQRKPKKLLIEPGDNRPPQKGKYIRKPKLNTPSPIDENASDSHFFESDSDDGVAQEIERRETLDEDEDAALAKLFNQPSANFPDITGIFVK